MFITADSYLGPHRGGDTPPVHIVRSSWPHHIARFRMPTDVGGEVRASINHGRWIVSCPTCAGAQLACEADPRFFCVDCLHAGTPAEGKWLRVVWPAPGVRDAIEATLRGRPAAARNWTTETVAELNAENDAALALQRGATLRQMGLASLRGDIAALTDEEFDARAQAARALEEGA